ncbi:MAG: hypothetical protein V4519_04125 [Patescibacteria group bacterium]
MDSKHSWIALPISVIVLAFILRDSVSTLVNKWTTPVREPTMQEAVDKFNADKARIVAEQQAAAKATEAMKASLLGPDSTASSPTSSTTPSGTRITPPPVFVYQPGTTPDYLPWPDGRAALIAPSRFDGPLEEVSMRAQDYYPGLPAGVVYDCVIVVETGKQIWIYGNGFRDSAAHRLPAHTDLSGKPLPRYRLIDMMSVNESPVKVTLEFNRKK